MQDFITGVAVATLLWIGVLAWVMVEHRRELREVEDRAFSEGYSLRKRNNLLERENRQIDRQYRKYRREHP